MSDFRIQATAPIPTPFSADPLVANVQTRLNDLYGPGALQVDGVFGPRTQAAVVRFQTDAGLSPHGQLDQQTLAALNDYSAAPTPVVVDAPVAHARQHEQQQHAQTMEYRVGRDWHGRVDSVPVSVADRRSDAPVTFLHAQQGKTVGGVYSEAAVLSGSAGPAAVSFVHSSVQVGVHSEVDMGLVSVDSEIGGVDVARINAYAGVRGKHGETGARAGAEATLIDVHVGSSDGPDEWRFGLGVGIGGHFELTVRDADADGHPEICAGGSLEIIAGGSAHFCKEVDSLGTEFDRALQDEALASARVNRQED